MTKKISRKKALAIMVETHSKNQTQFMVRLDAENLTTQALFPLRETIVEKIMEGHDPYTVISDQIDTAIKLNRVSMTSSETPSFRDVMSDEMRTLLQNL